MRQIKRLLFILLVGKEKIYILPNRVQPALVHQLLNHFAFASNTTPLIHMFTKLFE